jgi:Spy/CpxP family protein refolding chaperone
MISNVLTTPLSTSLRRSLAAAALGLGLLGTAACTGAAVDESTQTADGVAAAPVPPPLHVARAGGPGAFLLREAASLDLRPEQKQALSAVRARVDAAVASERDAHARLDAEIAKQVRAGAIDRGRLQPLVGALDAAAAERMQTSQKAVGELHDLLDASQRKALMQAMSEKKGKHGPGGRRHEGKKEGAREGMKHGPRGGMKRGPLEGMARDLNLTEEQKASIRAKMAAGAEKGDERRHGPPPGREHMEAFRAAFEADRFDPSAFGPGGRGAPPPRMGGRMVDVLEAAVPVLDADQREKLARRMEEGPRAGRRK